MELILEHFRVLSRSTFSCAGEVIETRGDGLARDLADCLYRLCYTRRFTGAFVPSTQSPEVDQVLLRELQAANSSRTIHVDGWMIEQAHPSGKILARRNGVVRWFLPGCY